MTAAGFHTTTLRRRRRAAASLNGDFGGAPRVVSARAYLRRALPAVYQEGDFGLRFVGALEHVVDPSVALLDGLAAYVKPDLAPPDMIEALAAWLGLPLEESWPDERRRELVRRAPELIRRRGTKAGLQLTLEIAYPDLPLRVEETGGVAWATDAESLPRAKAPSFAVYCDAPLTEEQQAAVARTIERARPVHVAYKLRVKAAPAAGG